MQDPKLSISSQGRARVRRLTRGLTLLAVATLAFGCGDSDERADWEDGDAAFLEDRMPGAFEGDLNFDGGFPVEAADPSFGAFPPDSLGYDEDPEEYDEYEEYESDAGGFASEEGGYEGGYDVGTAPDQGGWGGDDGGFRGQAEVGGVPQVSGTIDSSGEGNHVFSVGGEVLDLP